MLLALDAAARQAKQTNGWPFEPSGEYLKFVELSWNERTTIKGHILWVLPITARPIFYACPADTVDFARKRISGRLTARRGLQVASRANSCRLCLCPVLVDGHAHAQAHAQAQAQAMVPSGARSVNINLTVRARKSAERAHQSREPPLPVAATRAVIQLPADWLCCAAHHCRLPSRLETRDCF